MERSGVARRQDAFTSGQVAASGAAGGQESAGTTRQLVLAVLAEVNAVRAQQAQLLQRLDDYHRQDEEHKAWSVRDKEAPACCLACSTGSAFHGEASVTLTHAR
jgi:hypothetical protein